MDKEEIKTKVWAILPRMTEALRSSLEVRPKYNALLTRAVGVHPMPHNRGNGNFLAWTLLRDERTRGDALGVGALDDAATGLYDRRNLVAAESDLPEAYQEEIEKQAHNDFQEGIRDLCELLKEYIKAYPEKAYGGAFIREVDINLCEVSASGEFVDYLVKVLLNQGVLDYTGLKGPRGSHMLKVARDEPYSIQPMIAPSRLRKGVSAGEALAAAVLRELYPDLRFVHQKKWKDCRDKRELPFDFYDEENGLVIEVDGAQHFRPVEYFGGKESYEYVKRHDSMKNRYAAEKDLKLIRIDSSTRDVGAVLRSVYANLERLPPVALYGEGYGIRYLDERLPDDLTVSFDRGIGIFND